MAKEKKANVGVSIDGSQGTQTFDSSKFKEAYEEWKGQCGSVSGEQMGITSDKTLLDLVAAHGDTQVARPYTDDPLDDGAGNVVELLDALLDLTDGITEEDKKNVTKVYTKLKNMQNTEADPRNIVFTVPIFRKVNRKNADYDEETDTKEVYGHYRTTDYVKYRNLKAKLFGGKEESIKAVSSDWYNTSKNTAEPPMWQALFAGDGTLYEVKKSIILKQQLVSNGLVYILSETVKALEEDVSFEHLKLKIVDSGKGVTAPELMTIDAIKEYMAECVGTPQAPGWGINKTTGMFRDTHVNNRLKAFTFIDIGVKDSKTVKRVADYDKFIGEVKGISVNISRRQTKNLAILTGKCKRTPGKETVFMPGVAKPKPVEKKKKEVKKSWKSVLAW